MKNPRSQAYGVRHEAVNGQALQPYSGDALGLSSFARAGCCPIATYNAMVLLGRDMSLGQVADQYMGGPCGSLLFGLWGCAPWNTARFLRRFLGKDRYRGFLRLSRLEKAAKEGDVLIFFMMNDRFLPTRAFHCMAARYEHDGLRIYNVDNRSRGPLHFKALRDKTREGRYLYGFLISPDE